MRFQPNNWLFRKLTAALALALAAAVLVGAWQAGQTPQLPDKLIRLHVIGASDSEEDQARKLQVRNAVTDLTGPLLAGSTGTQDARAILCANLDAIQAAAQETLADLGCNDSVRVSLGQAWFPEKDYDTFSLPEGQYEALRVTIAQGAGQNWWCVVFPSLCLCATTQEVADVAAAAGFTADEISAMTQGEGGVVFRWRVAQWWQQLFGD